MASLNVTRSLGFSMAMIAEEEKRHVAVFPSAGMGHFMPFLHFARMLAIHHGFSVTFITAKENVSPIETAHARLLADSGLDIRVVKLEIESPQAAKEVDPFFAQWDAMKASMAAFERLVATDLLQRSPPVSAIIADAILTPTFHIAAKFKLPIYILFPASAFTLGLMVYAPVLEAQGFDFSDEKAVLQIPGFPPLPTTQIAQALRIKDHIFRRIFLSSGSEVAKTSGILVNTFEELEEDCLQALRSGQAARDLQLPPVYAVGPLFWSSNLSTSDDETQKRCLTWLDAQPAKSVVYVSFGSRSAMSAAQVSELALGLESSQQRFLWVLRTSVVDGASSDPAVLPPGFESRVQDRCLVVSSWVPQVKILSHVSTGAFVSHCGWNSVVEGVCCGVPMVAWPLFGDQMMNARIVAENAKVGVQIRKDENGIVTEEEVESAVRSVMKGEEFRSAATKMGKLGRIAVSEGGSSDKSLKQALHNWNE